MGWPVSRANWRAMVLPSKEELPPAGNGTVNSTSCCGQRPTAGGRAFLRPRRGDGTDACGAQCSQQLSTQAI
jgi:hypothetical protein